MKKNERKNKVSTEYFLINEIVDNKINNSRRHWFIKASEQLYRVGWYGYEPNHEICDPTTTYHEVRSYHIAVIRNSRFQVILAKLKLDD